MTSARFKATNDADDVARRFEREARAMQRELNDAVREVGEEAELIYAVHALKDTGRMSRGIKSRVAGNEAIVTVHAKNPESGYDYVGVTRFGHRKRRIDRGNTRIEIRPRKAKALRIELPTGTIFRRSARIYRPLAFRIGGKLIMRRSVRGFHPERDWAEPGHQQSFRAAQRIAARLGRGLTVRMRGA